MKEKKETLKKKLIKEYGKNKNREKVKEKNWENYNFL